MIQLAALAAIREDLERVEAALLSISPPDYPELDNVIRDLVSAGGKRIRPALVLLAGRCNRYSPERLLDGAVSIELLHTATLVHDDTIDSAALRRGRATVNSYLPAKAAILIGDYIFAQAAMFASRPQHTSVISIFARTLMEICDGELRQMMGNHRAEVSRDDYYRRIYAKTAALFACATEIGAVLTDAPQRERRALRLYGEKLGMAFQVVDDVIDFSSTSEQAGKPVGSDLQQGTATLPTIIFLERASYPDGHAEAVRRALEGAPDADHARAVELIRESDALELACEEARAFTDEAKAALLELPSGEARDALAELADYVGGRER